MSTEGPCTFHSALDKQKIWVWIFHAHAESIAFNLFLQSWADNAPCTNLRKVRQGDQLLFSTSVYYLSSKRYSRRSPGTEQQSERGRPFYLLVQGCHSLNPALREQGMDGTSAKWQIHLLRSWNPHLIVKLLFSGTKGSKHRS